ncbi:hypothetical protein U1Q18_033051, partial [Sarracenia purpurea var. burkii]
ESEYEEEASVDEISKDEVSEDEDENFEDEGEPCANEVVNEQGITNIPSSQVQVNSVVVSQVLSSPDHVPP